MHRGALLDTDAMLATYCSRVWSYKAYGYELLFIPKLGVSERADCFEAQLDH